ncbi:gag-pol precursor [Canna indica]|uniref:Gag-pol n=1 Tax=Canna indica TaxID=4628 RepID=A0AAQ3QTP3_9LILI|nr:gag-pol precursor [Canna indica]
MSAVSVECLHPLEFFESEWKRVSRRRSASSSRRVTFASAPKPSSLSWIGVGRSFAQIVRLGCPAKPSPHASEAVGSPSTRVSAPVHVSPTEASPEQLSSLEDLVASLRRRGKCFNCLEAGHLARHCVNRRVCFLCHRAGHSWRSCSNYRRKDAGIKSDRSASHVSHLPTNAAFTSSAKVPLLKPTSGGIAFSRPNINFLFASLPCSFSSRT